MRLDLSSDCLHMSRSESVSELNSDGGLGHGLTPVKGRSSYAKDIEGTPPKPFGGLGKSLYWFVIYIICAEMNLYIVIDVFKTIVYR